MVGQNFMEEIDCGTFFDLVDFPSEDIESGLTQTGRDSFPTVWSTPAASMMDGSGSNSHSVFSNNNCNPDLSAELSVPYEDIVQLEWLSNFVEDSFSGENLTMNKEVSSKDSSYNQQQFHSCSPVSVLESSSSSSGKKTAPQKFTSSGRCGRARSKRPRPTAFHPRPPIQLIPQASSFTETKPSLFSHKSSSDAENSAESGFCVNIPKAGNGEQAKRKKTKLSIPLAPVDANQNAPSHSVRKCLHCEITKTPQWRAGPMGPKTLCNACGVRYKSGRLFPEYRPAASPTFIPSVHSNSHRKVLEMRSKATEKVAEVDTESTPLTPLDLIPNANALVDCI